MSSTDKPRIFAARYINGLPEVKYKTSITFQAFPEFLRIKLLKGFKWITIDIPPEDIIEVGLNQEVYRSAGKAATGAIIGGALTGGIGLIAGAALGGKRRKDNELKLEVLHNGQNCDIHLKSNKVIPDIYNAIKKILPIAEDTERGLSDASDQIEKLHGLMIKGIITEDEFNQKKKELLNL